MNESRRSPPRAAAAVGRIDELEQRLSNVEYMVRVLNKYLNPEEGDSDGADEKDELQEDFPF